MRNTIQVREQLKLAMHWDYYNVCINNVQLDRHPSQITCLHWSRIVGRLLHQAWKSVLTTRRTVAKRLSRGHFLFNEGNANTHRHPEVIQANSSRDTNIYRLPAGETSMNLQTVASSSVFWYFSVNDRIYALIS